MTDRRDRVVRVVMTLGWLIAVLIALVLGCTSDDINPQQLGGLFLATYLGLWGLYFFRAKHGPIGKAARFLVCTLSIGAVVGALEALALCNRIDYRSVFQTPAEPWKRRGNRPDPDLVYVRDGNQSFRRRLTGNDIGVLTGARSWQIYQCEVRYDRNGFRNPSDLNSADVIVVGDSFIEGPITPQSEVVTSRLAEALHCGVANLGRVGDGPQQELGVLKRYGLGLRPRACVWAFYDGNDLRDAGSYDSHRESAGRYAAQSELQSVAERSLARNGLNYVIRNWLKPQPRPPARLYTGRFVAPSGAPIDMTFGSPDHFDSSAPGGAREQSPELYRVRAALAEAHALCRDHGIDLVLVFIPTKFRVYRELCTFDPASPCPAWPIDDLPRALAQIAAEISPEIGYIDLTPWLHKAAARGDLVYLPDDTHWTSEGHKVASRAIGEYLQSRPEFDRRRVGGEMSRTAAGDARTSDR
jgi:uncharacterized membrane protein YeaQ/YmgE (transglycosylase-associated protein family)